MREIDIDFPGFGILPPKRNTWYDFGINYKRAPLVLIHLCYGPIDSVYPTYFGRKEELTDEHGVFDVAKVDRLVQGKDPDTPQA
jgi:hypothetical protein